MKSNRTLSGLRLPDEVTEPNSWASAILIGLQTKQVYPGTVHPATIARRRSRNRAARTTRQQQRSAA